MNRNTDIWCLFCSSSSLVLVTDLIKLRHYLSTWCFQLESDCCIFFNQLEAFHCCSWQTLYIPLITMVFQLSLTWRQRALQIAFVLSNTLIHTDLDHMLMSGERLSSQRGNIHVCVFKPFFTVGVISSYTQLCSFNTDVIISEDTDTYWGVLCRSNIHSCPIMQAKSNLL